MMINLSEITDFLCNNNIVYKFHGNKNLIVQHYCPISILKDHSMTWMRSLNEQDMEKIANHKNILLICNNFEYSQYQQINFLFVDNPHKVFFILLENFFTTPKNNASSFSSTSVVETRCIGEGISVGHHTYIAPNVKIGNNVQIGSNVTIENNVCIGNHTVIESGVVIGACGFGHYVDNNGKNVRVPHLGGVRIGKHVNIGANTTIARGTLSDTIINDYVKIDNLCHIAHNVVINDNVLIAGGTVIGGSTIINEDVWLSSCKIANSLVIGAHSYIGGGSIVTKNIPENKFAVGYPARVVKNVDLEKSW
ncbi:MAG: hypothetical protein FWD44_00035 [Oscillospiraceae bacterium]|nr:hypothetical protein [Oscillospiraceae bacterium]